MNAQAWVALAALTVTVAIFMLSRQRDRRVRRAELVRAYTNDFYSDERVTRIFIELEYGRLQYNDVRDTTDEMSFVRLLDLLNAVAHAVRQRVLHLDDVLGTTLGYAVLVTSTNEAVRDFLNEVDEIDLSEGFRGPGFRYFRWLAGEIDNTWDKKSGLPPRNESVRVSAARVTLLNE